MPHSEPQKYKYFAFISYSRKDSRQAKWLQKRLEWFRIPTKIGMAQDHLRESRYIRPVYRDKTNLEVDHAHYWENIQGAIHDSRYLIVLCSPASAASQAVDAEVRWFLQTHDSASELIIPIVLAGRVGDGGDEECLCPALKELGEVITSRNLPTMVPDSDDHEKDAWENGFIGAVSYMLKIHRGFLSDHLRRDERRKALVIRMIAVSMGLLAMAAVALSFYAQAQTKAAIAAKAESQAKLERSWFEEGLRWWASARGELAAGNATAASFLAARAVGFENYGREKVVTSKAEWDEAYPPLLHSAIASDPLLDEKRSSTVQQIDDWVSNATKLLPIWASPEVRHASESFGLTAFSWDGSRLAAKAGADQGSELQVWNLETGGRVARFETGGVDVTCLAVGPAGELLATNGEENEVLVWDYLRSSTARRLHGHTAPVKDIAFSADGARITSVAALESGGLELRTWDVKTGDVLAEGRVPTPNNELFRLCRDGSRLGVLAEGGKKAIELWDTLPVRRGLSVEAFEEDLDFALNLQGRVITILSKKGDVRQLDALSGQPVTRMHMPLDNDEAVLHPYACTEKGVTVLDGQKLRRWASDIQKEKEPVALGNGLYSSLDMSPDGRLFSEATVGVDGVISVRSTEDGSRVYGQPQPLQPIDKACFSADGMSIVTVSVFGSEVCVWDALTGSLVKHWPLANKGSYCRISCGQISDHAALAFENTGDTSNIVILDYITGQQSSFLEKIPGRITDVQYSPDETLLAAAFNKKDFNSEIYVWEVSTRKLKLKFDVEAGFRNLLFSSDGVVLASGGNSGIRAWEVSSGKVLPCSKKPGGVLAFQYGSKQLLAGNGTTLDVYNLVTGGEIGSIPSHDLEITAVAANQDGLWLTGSKDQTMRVWGLKIGHYSTPPLGGPLKQTVFHADGRRLLTVAAGRMILWNFTRGRQRSLFEAHKVNGMACAYSSDGSVLATSGWDGGIKLWSTEFKDRTFPENKGEPTGTFFESEPVKGLALTADGRTLLTAAGQTITLRDSRTWKWLRSLYGGHSGAIERLVANADASLVVSADSERYVRIWDLKHKSEFAAEFQHTGSMVRLALSEDGTFLVSSSFDGDVKIWDLKSRREIRTFNAGFGLVSLALSPDAEYLACGYSHGEIKMFSRETGKLSGTLAGHRTSVAALGFNRDGSRLLSGAEQGKLMLWDMNQRSLLSQWQCPGSTTPVQAVAFSPDGSLAVSCSDGRVRFWDVEQPPQDLASGLNRRLFVDDRGGISVSALGDNLALQGSLFLGSLHQDAIAAVSAMKPGSSAYDGMLMQAKLQSGDIRGGIRLWQQSKQRETVRRHFLLLLLHYLAYEPNAPGELYQQALENALSVWAAEDWDKPDTAQLLIRLSVRNLPDARLPLNLRERLEQLVLKAPIPAVMSITERLGQRWQESKDEAARSSISNFVKTALVLAPENRAILRVAINMEEKGTEGWLQLTRRLRASPQILSEDYVALVAFFPEQVQQLMAECSQKWRDDQNVQRDIALTFMERGENAQALAAFRRSLALRHPQDAPKPFILVGFCSTLWLLGEKEEARKTYFDLLKCSRFWADMEWLGKNMPNEKIRKSLSELYDYCKMTEPEQLKKLSENGRLEKVTETPSGK